MKQRMNRSNSKQSEFEDKVVSIKRVTKVVKGGVISNLQH